MAYTLNRRLAQLIDSSGQLNTGKIPNDYITSDHVADNTITAAMLHTSFTVSTSNLTSIDTDDVSEGTSNLYFTDARARGAVSATGSLSYNSSTGVFSFTQGDTDTVSEGSTNLYFTNARADARIALQVGANLDLSSKDTDDLSEGSTNLYFTNARIDSHLSGGTGVTYSSGAISIGQDVGTTATPTFGNITTTGYIAGPATFTIDPAAVGDNTGTVVIAGDLQVDGTTTTINSTTVNIDDLNIQLATGAANAAAANGAGITVDGASATITYDSTNDRWDFNKSIEIGSGYSGTPNTESQLILNDTGNNYITIGSGASSEGGILFADSSDNDAGVITYSHSTNSLAFRTNGVSNRMIIDSSGNVGVGASTINEKLEVKGAIGFQASNSTNRWSAYTYTDNTFRLNYNGAGADEVTIDSSGNFGIGTVSPSGRLHIQPANSDTLQNAIFTRQNNAAGTDGNTFVLRNDAANNFVEMNSGGTNNGGFKFYRGSFSGDPALTIVGSGVTGGNVGIGTETPQTLFETATTGTTTNRLTVSSANEFTQIWVEDNDLQGILWKDGSDFTFGPAADVGGSGWGPYITIKDGGNIGIGTASPEERLHVMGQAVFDNIGNTNRGNIIMGAHGSGTSKWATLAATHYNEATGSGNGSGNAGVMVIGSESAASYNKVWIGHGPYELNPATQINFGTHSATTHNLGGTTRMVINSSGNVGIGESNPALKLHVSDSASVTRVLIDNTSNATAGSGIYLRTLNSGSLVSNATVRTGNNGDFSIWTGTTGEGQRLTIDGSGNVGIGTTDPTGKFEVKGGRMGVIANSSYSSWGHFRIANISDGEIGMAFINGATESDFLADTDPACSYKVILGINPYGAGTRNFGIGNDTMASYHTIWTEAGHQLPAVTNTYDLGSGSQRFRTLYSDNISVATTTNYDPPGLGNSNATFSVLKRDGSSSGNYGMITGVSNDGNVWSQVQRVDGTATAYNLYLQPSGGSVGIGIPQNHTYIPNLIYPLRVGKSRTGLGNVTDYLTKIAIDAIGYAGSNYQFGAIDFTGGDTAGASGNHYGRIGCSSMIGTNNQETGSLEFYVKAPSFGMSGTTHAMKIHGQVNTSSAGGGTTRNGVLFTYQGLAIDRSWADYPCINVMNSTPYSTSSSTQSELRIHGNNVSSASYPGTSGSDFSCTVRADGGYATGSDRRRKRNIETIDNALSTVKQLTGKRFQTVNRSEEVQEQVSKNGYKLGFIAQDVEDIIPEAVIYHEDEDDGTENWNSAYAMDYGSVVALLVNAIKEQDTVIEDLKSRIETLEG